MLGKMVAEDINAPYAPTGEFFLFKQLQHRSGHAQGVFSALAYQKIICAQPQMSTHRQAIQVNLIDDSTRNPIPFQAEILGRHFAYPRHPIDPMSMNFSTSFIWPAECRMVDVVAARTADTESIPAVVPASPYVECFA